MRKNYYFCDTWKMMTKSEWMWGDRPFFSSTKFLKEEIVYENTNYHATVN